MKLDLHVLEPSKAFNPTLTSQTEKASFKPMPAAAQLRALLSLFHERKPAEPTKLLGA